MSTCRQVAGAEILDFTPSQGTYRPGINLVNASILCTALGGDHNKDPSQEFAEILTLLGLVKGQICTDILLDSETQILYYTGEGSLL